MENQQKIIRQLPAGLLPSDANIEMFGNRKTKKVFFLQCGRVRSFAELPHHIRIQLERALLRDKPAQRDLSGLTWSEALEQYSFCLFGAADQFADYTPEGLKPENFRCGQNCRCQKWNSKNINYKGAKLTLREIQIIDLLKTGQPDKAIAAKLGIALPTLNNQKKALMRKLDAQNKTEVVFNATASGIIQ